MKSLNESETDFRSFNVFVKQSVEEIVFKKKIRQHKFENPANNVDLYKPGFLCTLWDIA